jgi:hypothetical protein
MTARASVLRFGRVQGSVHGVNLLLDTHAPQTTRGFALILDVWPARLRLVATA